MENNPTSIPSASNIQAAWTPSYLIVDSSLREHPKVAYIIQRCPTSKVIYLETASNISDFDIMKSISEFDGMSESQLMKASRNSLLLSSQSELFQSMSVGHTQERCCYNFLKIIPYRGVCQASCGYCWFQDKILIPRINVTFVDDFIKLLNNSDQSQQFKQTVFTMTHYKTDCVCVEHITGFISDLYSRASELNGAHIQLLTKFADFDFLYGSPAKKELLICFSINTETVNNLLEPKTSSIMDRIQSAKKLKDLGYTVMFRVDPMLCYQNSEAEYATLANEILTTLTPDHITLGTCRFQSMDEIELCLNNLKGLQRDFFSCTTNKIAKSKPGIPVAGDNHSSKAYFKNMQYSLPENERKALYRSFINVSRELSFLGVGLCEEPLSMWQSLGVRRTGECTTDCSCNFIPMQAASNE